MEWNTGATCGAGKYEGVINTVGFSTVLAITITTTDPVNCDTGTSYTMVAGDNNSDSVTVDTADHDGSTLTVTATVTSGSCTGKTYNVDYPDGSHAPTDMTCTGGTGLSYTWGSAPAYVDLQEVTVHSADPGGAKVSGSVTGPAASGNLMPEHWGHKDSGYVIWGSEPYTVTYESCFNCHGPDDDPVNNDTVMHVHNGKCNLCHVSAAPGISGNPITLMWKTGTEGSDTAYPDYPNGRKNINQDLDFTNDTIASGTCTDCHYAFMSKKDIDPGPGENLVDLRFKTWNHHLSENAQQGNCVNCHDSVRKTSVGLSWCVVEGSRVPRQPPCAYCHVDADRAYNGDGGWQLQFFDFAADGFNTPLTKLTSSTHSIPNVDGIAGDNRPAAGAVFIHDFAVCFECHDKSATSEGDLQETMLDGGGLISVLGPAAVPNKVYPYHASGMSLDLSGGSRTSADPGGVTWFPVDKTKGGYDNNAECAKEGTTCGTDGPIWNNDIPASTTGPTGRNDLFFAYQYHPGRGGIVGTSDVIGGVSAQVGSFNTLFPLMTPFTAKNSQYYQKGGAASGNTFKHAYEGAGLDGNHGSGNFGTGGAGGQTATPSYGYTDAYGRTWDFRGIHNVPYTDYKINPQAVDNTGDVYWSTVPVFPDLSGDDIPSITDKVRLLSVDCATQTVTARSDLTGDWNFNPTPVGTDMQISITGASPETVDMTYDAPSDTWTGSLSAVCVTDDIVTVTSSISGGGSASFTVP
jgi:hypothetical protein